jgi:hypothetical protein
MAERAVRGNRPLEMSKPTYQELATNFDLWCKFVLFCQDDTRERDCPAEPAPGNDQEAMCAAIEPAAEISTLDRRS